MIAVCEQDAGAQQDLCTRVHDGGAGSRHPVVPRDNHYEIHLETNLFFRSPIPGADSSFEMQPALPGLSERSKGKHALLRQEASKSRICPVAPHPWLRARKQSQIFQIRLIPRQVSAKTAHLRSRQRAETQRERRAITVGCYGTVHG